MTALYITLSIIASALILFLSASLYRSIRYRRSLFSSVVEIYLRLTNPRWKKERLIKAVERKKERGYIPYSLPRLQSFRVSITEENFRGMQLFRFSKKKKKKDEKETAILYLHGGAYYRNPRISHIKFVLRLAARSDFDVYLPIYPKAPFATAKETKAAVIALYLELISQSREVILMGDSSGGGLALLLLQMLSGERQPLPKRAILLSPWVDIGMSDPRTPIYEKYDPLIWVESGIVTAESWASGIKLSSPEVSPLYGELRGLCDLSIFVGDRELLFPEVDELHKRLDREAIPHDYIVDRGMNHVYPIYPIREAKHAMAQILEILKQ